MARRRIADPPRCVDPAASALVEDYLAAIAARLPGPRHNYRAAMSELRDGLHDALTEHRRTGVNDLAAARIAVAESGPPAVVASAYAPILTNRYARRTSQTLLATGPFIGALWLLALSPGSRPAALLLTVPALATVLTVGVIAGLVAVAATGPIARRLPDIPRLPQRSATLICAAAIAIDLAVLGLAAAQLASSPGAPHWPLMVAAVASLGRLVYTQRATRYQLHAAR